MLTRAVLLTWFFFWRAAWAAIVLAQRVAFSFGAPPWLINLLGWPSWTCFRALRAVGWHGPDGCLAEGVRRAP